MAGILITAGHDIGGDHARCREHFICKKQMGSGSDEQFGEIMLSKFSRKSSDDSNCVAGDTIGIWAVGTLIYKDRIGKSALESLLSDLQDSALEDLVHHCDGPFFLAVGDRSGRSLRLVTDHAGIMNIYVYRSETLCALSSSSMALSTHYPVTPDPDGVAQFLRTANVYGSGTIYREITLLEPASIYTLTASPWPVLRREKQYWKSPVETRTDLSFEKAKDLLVQTLLSYADIFSRQNLVCDFTAGFDSRLIVAAFSRHRALTELPTFVFGPEESKEVRLVVEYCRSLGIRNHHLTLGGEWEDMIHDYVERALYVTDGEENVVVYAPILLAQESKALGHGCSINGLGGELYRDFWWIQEMYASRRPANLERLIAMRILQYEYDYTIFSGTWRTRLAGVKDTLKRTFLDTLSDMDLNDSLNTLQIDNLYLRQKMRRWAGRTISSSNQIVGTLAPLSLKRCVETALSIPPGCKRNGRLVKGMIEQLCPPLSTLRMLNGAPCQNLTIKNAHMFLPLIIDLGKRGVRKAVQKALNRTILLDRSIGYQQSRFVSSLLSRASFQNDYCYDSLLTRDLYDRGAYERFYSHASREGFLYSNQLGNILTLEMRMRRDNIRQRFSFLEVPEHHPEGRRDGLVYS